MAGRQLGGKQVAEVVERENAMAIADRMLIATSGGCRRGGPAKQEIVELVESVVL